MKFFSSKTILALALISTSLCASVASAASASVIAPTSTTPTISAGASEFTKAIAAEKARLAQLNKKLHPNPAITHTLRKGSTGNDVLLLQKFLKLYGTFNEPEATSYFGAKTAQAVKDFQRKESLDQVGFIGPKTRARILALSEREVVENSIKTATTSPITVPTITNAIFSNDVGEDGSGVGSASTFASTTKNIYAVLTLANAKQDTAIGLIRYFNDTYVDSVVSHPSRSGLRYIHFQWSLKEGARRTVGTYTINFYIDGKKSATATYTIN